MSYPKQDPEKRKYGVGACVTLRIRNLLIQEATRRKTTIGEVAGEILTEWAGDRIPERVEDVRQYVMFSRDQKEVKQEGKMYKEGALGKEKARLEREGIRRVHNADS